MIKLTVAGTNPPTEALVTFRLDNDGQDVNVYANDDLIGWFELGKSGIEFVRSYPHDTTVFSVDEIGYLTVR